MDRRQFLIGLLGTAAVVAAGPLPKALAETLPEKEFIRIAREAQTKFSREIYCNGRDYAFAQIRWIDTSPYIEIFVPEGFKPMREESDRIEAEVLKGWK